MIEWRSIMRVIAGSARRLKLETVPGLETRPTTDRIKETLFNMIGHGMPEAVFLDLFSGSGAIGIEALSRGASQCYFVEQNPKAISCIKGNLEHTNLMQGGVVLAEDVFFALTKLHTQGIKFDYIFMDPPYGQLLERRVLEQLKEKSIIKEDVLIIIEADLQTDFSYVTELGYEILKEKKYKTNQHIFLEIKKG